MRHAAYVNNEVDDPSQGIPVLMPDIYDLDWDAIILQIHNGLVDNGLFSWADVQRQQTGLSSILRTTLMRHLIALYRMEDE